MVQPSFSALFGGPEVLSIRPDVEFLGEFAPLVFAVFASE